MKIGIVTTVKNEERLLRYNLLYHQYLGVEAAYVFSDNSTDNTIRCIEHLPFVYIYPSVLPDNFKNRPELDEFLIKSKTHVTARQCLNVCSAIEKARKIGLDWLISLDADELICLDFQNVSEGQLLCFFGIVKDNVEAIRFPTLEVVQRRLEYDNVFAEETLFKRQNVRIKRRIYDPYKKKLCGLSGFYGQKIGKSALRLNANAKPKTVHEFVALDGSKLNTLKAGYLLHYNWYSFNDFINKNKNWGNRQETYLYGKKIKYVPKLLWRDMVKDIGFSQEYLRDYYKKYIMFHEDEICALSKNRYLGIIPKRAGLVEVVSVRNAYKELLNL